jgi:hypothetical protein
VYCNCVGRAKIISGYDTSLMTAAGRASRPSSLTELAASLPRASRAGVPGAAGGLLKERIPTPDGTDGLTRTTIGKMAEYIRAGAQDPEVKRWAGNAVRTFAGGPMAPDAACAWSVFWYVKHRLTFAQDEPRLFQTGDAQALDMLIAPAVLVRMANPKEDCDGFTMLVCAMLEALREAGADVEPLIVTVAADPSDPTRWSHVFALARLASGEVIPLDASHGRYPGWMVPKEHTSRWQSWGLDGQPANVARPESVRLNGYAPRGSRMRGMSRGMGCTIGETDPTTGDTIAGCVDDGSSSVTTSFPWFTPSPSSTPGSSFNWSSVLNNLVSTAGKVAGIAETPTQTIRLPDGTIVSGPAGSNLTTPGLFGSGSSLLPILGLGLLAVLFMSSRGKG